MHLFKLASDSEINRKCCPRVLGFVRREFEKGGGEEASLIHEGLQSHFADTKSKLTEVKFIQLSQTPQCTRKPRMWWYWIKSPRQEVMWTSPGLNSKFRQRKKSIWEMDSGRRERKDHLLTVQNGKAAEVFTVTDVLTVSYRPYIKIFMSLYVTVDFGEPNEGRAWTLLCLNHSSIKRLFSDSTLSNYGLINPVCDKILDTWFLFSQCTTRSWKHPCQQSCISGCMSMTAWQGKGPMCGTD